MPNTTQAVELNEPKDKFEEFAIRLVADLDTTQSALRNDPAGPQRVAVDHPRGGSASLNLTPFACRPQPVDGAEYFAATRNLDQLLENYHRAKSCNLFEDGLIGAKDKVSGYADEFLQNILDRSCTQLDDQDARRIAQFVSNLDLYTAVKSVESLLNSKADLKLLQLAEHRGWTLHFDHLAIRCGSADDQAAERVVDNLMQHHGYTASQIASENYFQFTDGWDAYVLYKILENGQQLRLFIDQSSSGYPAQIIQHWNHVYGYTAHHLAIRATRLNAGARCAISLRKLIHAIEKQKIQVLTPTGDYTDGLLEQVFTRPEKNPQIPPSISHRLQQVDSALEKSIGNGKLLELVSRREINHRLKENYFDLYGITFDADNPLHSAPVYPYFLPAQAAHVIKTSIQVA